MKTSPMVPAVALSLSASVASAGAIFTSQARSIETAGGLSGASFLETAPGFGPFVASRQDSFENIEGEPEFFNSYGNASQSSFLNENFVRLSGTVSGGDAFAGAGAGLGIGISRFDVVFELASDTPFSFFGTHSTSGHIGSGGVSDWNILLSGESGGVLFERSVSKMLAGDSDQTPGPFSQTGILPAGTYRLKAIFTEGGSGFGTTTGSGSFDLTLHIPGTPTAAILCPVAFWAGRRRR